MTCPAVVYSFLSQFVQDEMAKVTQVQWAVNSVLNIEGALTSVTVAAVNEIVDLIPDPVPIDLQTIMDLLTCPLTPAAVGVFFYRRYRQQVDLADVALNFQNLSWDTQKAWAEEFLRAYVQQLNFDFTVRLRGLAQWVLVRNCYQFVEMLYTISSTPESLAIASNICLQVKTLTPDIYYGSIFESFDQAVADFSFTANLPTNLTGMTRQVTEAIQRGTMKLTAWRQAYAIPAA
jgi:hypothetical protein